MSDAKHTYPSNYPPGCHWAITEGWSILDMLKPGLIEDDVRAFLCGAFAGALSRISQEGAPCRGIIDGTEVTFQRKS